MTLSFEEQLKLEEKENKRTMENVNGMEFRTAFDIWEERKNQEY